MSVSETPEELARRKKREYYRANWDKYAAWREAYKLKKQTINRKWNASVSLEQKMIWSAKRRAKRKGLEFSITADDIKIPSTCPLLNIPLRSKANKKVAYDSPTLDRKDNTLGYIKENVWIISHKANNAKGSLSINELELLVNNLREAVVEQHCGGRRQEGTDSGVGGPTGHPRCCPGGESSEGQSSARSVLYRGYTNIEDFRLRYTEPDPSLL